MQSVDQIDEVTSTFQRLPDRPDGSFLRVPRGQLTPEASKALQRMRTAAWRQQNDRRGRPTSEQIARALLVAVCTSDNFTALIDNELSVVRIAVDDMVERGFALSEIQDTMRGVRRRLAKRQDRTARP